MDGITQKFSEIAKYFPKYGIMGYVSCDSSIYPRYIPVGTTIAKANYLRGSSLFNFFHTNYLRVNCVMQRFSNMLLNLIFHPRYNVAREFKDH